MQSIIGTWRLVGEDARDPSGAPLPHLLRRQPLGVASFNESGRMVVVISEGDARAPSPAYVSYCGAYRFDGSTLVTTADGGSEPRFTAQPQTRAASFADGRMTLRPPPRVIDGTLTAMSLTWERVG